MRKLLSAFFVILVVATPALAQDKPVDVNVGFGVTFPTSGFGESFNTGWDGTIGVTSTSPSRDPERDIYGRMNGPEKTILVSPIPGGATSAQLIESNHQMHVGSFNLIYKTPSDRPVGGFVLGGAGIYHRMIQLTSPASATRRTAIVLVRVLSRRRVGRQHPRHSVVERLRHRHRRRRDLRQRSEVLRRDALPLCLGADHHAGRCEPSVGGDVDLLGGVQLERLVFPVTFGVRW